MTISDLQTLFGIINGMVGNTILILPLQGLIVGYMGVIIVTTILGIISGYTAYLVIKHLGKAYTINQTIEAHFAGDKKYSKTYNVFISATFWPQVFLYFKLLVLQVKSCFDLDDSWVLPFVIFAILFTLTTVLKNYGLGEKFLAYGIIGIIGYIFFLTWAQFSAPTGQKRLQAFGGYYQNFCSILLSGFSVHDFIVQVMIHNPDRKNYGKIIFLAYSIGIVYNIYAGLGSFAIINRTPSITEPQIIEDYYLHTEWQVHLIQFLYSIHLISTIPEYVLVSKVRLLQAFGYQEEQKIDLKGAFYIFLVLFISFLIYVLKTKLTSILIISGSIMSLFYVIIIPIAIHLKCLYYDQSCGFIQNDEIHNLMILKNQNECQCNLRYRSRVTKYLELAWIVISVIVGTYITAYTLWDMFYGKIKNLSN